jgi:hypothetical protein
MTPSTSMSTEPGPAGRSSLAATVELWREESERRRLFFSTPVDLGLRGDSGRRGPPPARPDEAEDYGLSETDSMTLSVKLDAPLPEGMEVRFRVGGVSVASTAPEGSVERRLVPALGALETRGHAIFLDCAGHTALSLSTRWPDEDFHTTVARWPLRVIPGKITPEELERLVEDLDSAARGVVFEAYSKAMVSLRRAAGFRPAAPPEKLERIAAILDLFGVQLARISNRPAQRLSLSPRRVLISPGDAITPETSASIAEDTSFLTRSATGVLPRERIELEAERDVSLPEHRALSGFLAAISAETREILDLLRSDIAFRLERRKLFSSSPGGILTEREEPRLAALRALEARARLLFSRSRDLRRRHEFLPADTPALRRPPEITKRFAHVGTYSVLYRAMREHHRSHLIDLGASEMLVGLKSLPDLWEYWVALRVIQCLQRRFRYAASPWETHESLFRRVVGFRDRYVLDLAGDRRLELVDEEGRRILFRYQPLYAPFSRRGALYGRLKRRGAPYEPDIAIEVYPAGVEDARIPEHIVILDAKYSSRAHEDLLDDVLRYRNIGDFRTGRRLVRQIWAVTNHLRDTGGPPAPERGGWTAPLETLVTVDNEAFLATEAFEGEICGVIGVRPGPGEAGDALDLLLRRALDGLGLRGRA